MPAQQDIADFVDRRLQMERACSKQREPDQFVVASESLEGSGEWYIGPAIAVLKSVATPLHELEELALQYADDAESLASDRNHLVYRGFRAAEQGVRERVAEHCRVGAVAKIELADEPSVQRFDVVYRGVVGHRGDNLAFEAGTGAHVQQVPVPCAADVLEVRGLLAQVEHVSPGELW